MAQFSLSWDAYKQNICHGLSALQQNGEFVDMTVAADGHHVKVHQMIMSLVSPYIKDLITSASCPHPVIFLNKISYPVLCAILEYIYTGEVMVDKDHLQDLIEAGRELHIKGLEDMKIELSSHPLSSQTLQAQRNEGQPLSETGYFDKPAVDSKEDIIMTRKRKAQSNQSRQSVQTDQQDFSDFGDDHHNYDDTIEALDDTLNDNTITDNIVCKRSNEDTKPVDATIQFTITNQGALQMVLNRYLYYLRYTSTKTKQGNTRSWKCINFQKKKGGCPAAVITKDDFVVKRLDVHDRIHQRFPDTLNTQIQYTLSGQGALRMILNRNIYYLKYTSRKTDHGCCRRWKCVNGQKQKRQCPAVVVTRDDIVIKRYGVHNHPFHDKQILRKARDNAIFTKINEAERSGQQKKLENRQEHPPKKAKTQGGGDTTTDAE